MSFIAYCRATGFAPRSASPISKSRRNQRHEELEVRAREARLAVGANVDPGVAVGGITNAFGAVDRHARSERELLDDAIFGARAGAAVEAERGDGVVLNHVHGRHRDRAL